jgi:hypothetical protein
MEAADINTRLALAISELNSTKCGNAYGTQLGSIMVHFIWQSLLAMRYAATKSNKFNVRTVRRLIG